MMRRFSSVSFVSGVIAGVLLAGIWFSTSPSDFFSLSSSLKLSPDAPKKALADASTAIQVDDQAAGMSVIVKSVAEDGPMWVAVREMKGEGLGNVLGAVRVTGPKGAVVVPLLRGTISGRTYAVQLYRDDADGPFDPSRFSAYIDFSSGTRVVAYFATTYDYHGS